MSNVNLIIIFIAVFLNAIAQIAIKFGCSEKGVISIVDAPSRILDYVFSWPILLGIFLYVFSLVIWIIALSRVDVSTAYPISSLGYVLVSVLAWFFFRESFDGTKVIGICVILFGVLLVAKS